MTCNEENRKLFTAFLHDASLNCLDEEFTRETNVSHALEIVAALPLHHSCSETKKMGNRPKIKP